MILKISLRAYVSKYDGEKIDYSLFSDGEYIARLYMKDDKKNRTLTGDSVIIYGVYNYSEKIISDCTYELIE